MSAFPNHKRYVFFIGFLTILVILGVYYDQKNMETLSSSKEATLSYLEQLELTPKNLYEIQIYCDSILISLDKNDISFSSKIKLHKARIHITNNKPKNAISLLEQILPHFKSTENYEYEVRCLIVLANGYVRLNKDSEAQMWALEGLEKAKKNKFSSLHSKANDMLSYLAYKNKDYDQALKYLKANLVLNIKNGDSSSVADGLNNIGILYKNQGRYQKAHEVLLEAQQIYRMQNNYDGLTSSHINIGRLYEKQGLMDRMKGNYLEAARLNEVYKIGNSIALRNVAVMHYSEKEYTLAKEYYSRALKLEKEESVLVNIYKDLLEIAIIENDNLAAMRAQKWYDYYSKKLINKQLVEKQQALEMQSRLYNEKILLESKQQYTAVVQALLTILIVLFIFIFLYFFQKFKTNRIFNEKNRVQLELKVLRSQMNPHFIFNALSAIQNTVMDKNPLQSAQYISRFAQLIRQNFDFTSKEKVPLCDDIDALENYLKTQQIRFENKFTYQIHLDPTIDAQTLEIPPMLLQPFVENAIEHGLKKVKKEGKIDIFIERKNTKIQFRIEDNGVGYFPKTDSKLHATQIIKKRLELLEMGDEKSFCIQHHPNQQGTQVQFSLNLLL